MDFNVLLGFFLEITTEVYVEFILEMSEGTRVIHVHVHIILFQ